MRKLFRWMFSAPEDVKLTDENIMRMLLPSLIGIVLCAVCLTGMTVAWYSMSIETPPVKISAGQYKLQEVKVTTTSSPQSASIASIQSAQGEEEPQPTVAPIGETTTYSLTQGQTYTVTLSPGAKDKHWYCMVSAGDGENKTVYYTPLHGNEEAVAGPDESFTFTIEVTNSEKVDVSITPCWGTYDTEANEGNILTGNDKLTVTKTGDTVNISKTNGQ